MAVCKPEIEIEMKTSVEKLWKNLKELTTFFPKALPDIYEKIDVIEGDGRSVGTVFVSTFKPSVMNPVAMTTTERVEMVDDEKKLLSYRYIEGEILKTCKNFKGVISVSSSSKGDGALIKYTAEFEKANPQVPDHPDFFKFVAKLFGDMDAYLLKT